MANKNRLHLNLATWTTRNNKARPTQNGAGNPSESKESDKKQSDPPTPQKSLKNFKKHLMWKRKWQIVSAFLIIIVIILCILFLFSTQWTTNDNQSILGIVNIKIDFPNVSAIIFLWMIFIISIFTLYKIYKSYCRYNNAITKLEILIKRLELLSDEDLLKAYRLDRELEMIYRILES